MSDDFDTILQRIGAILPDSHHAALDSPQSRTLLATRAREIAKPVERGDAGEDRREYLVFSIRPARYAVPLTAVIAIGKPLVTTLPGTPSSIVGVFNHRGTIYPLIDTRVLLDGQIQGLADRTTAVLVASPSAAAGLLVDEILDIRWLVGRTSAEVGGGDTVRRHIRSISDDAVGIVDIDALLSDSRLGAKS